MKAFHAVQKTVVDELSRTMSLINPDDCDHLIDRIMKAKRIFLSGAGRSGLAIRGFAMRLVHLGFTSFVTGDVTTPAITADDLLIIGSGSGSTSSLANHAEKAKSVGAGIALITIQKDSPIGKIADTILSIPAPSPKVKEKTAFSSIQPMGSLFEQTLALTLDSIIILLMDIEKITSDSMFENHANME
jgi:6-phospho-3-hexuloisomerase